MSIIFIGNKMMQLSYYIHNNLLHAGLVERPEQYRWNSLGYHVQTDNKDNFLSLDFGLKEFGVLDAEERSKHYRGYVYEAGAVNRSEKPTAGVINNSVLAKERMENFDLAGLYFLSRKY